MYLHKYNDTCNYVCMYVCICTCMFLYYVYRTYNEKTLHSPKGEGEPDTTEYSGGSDEIKGEQLNGGIKHL